MQMLMPEITVINNANNPPMVNDNTGAPSPPPGLFRKVLQAQSEVSAKNATTNSGELMAEVTDRQEMANTQLLTGIMWPSAMIPMSATPPISAGNISIPYAKVGDKLVTGEGSSENEFLSVVNLEPRAISWAVSATAPDNKELGVTAITGLPTAALDLMAGTMVTDNNLNLLSATLTTEIGEQPATLDLMVKAKVKDNSVNLLSANLNTEISKQPVILVPSENNSPWLLNNEITEETVIPANQTSQHAVKLSSTPGLVAANGYKDLSLSADKPISPVMASDSSRIFTVTVGQLVVNKETEKAAVTGRKTINSPITVVSEPTFAEATDLLPSEVDNDIRSEKSPNIEHAKPDNATKEAVNERLKPSVSQVASGNIPQLWAMQTAAKTEGNRSIARTYQMMELLAGTASKDATIREDTLDQTVKEPRNNTDGSMLIKLQQLVPHRSSPDNPRLSEQDGVKHVIQRLELMVKQNASQAKLMLKPEHLGNLFIHMDVQDGILTAKLLVDNQQAKAMLETNISVFRQQLEQNGIRVDKVEVCLNQPGSDGSQFSQPNQYRQPGQGGYQHMGSRNYWPSGREYGLEGYPHSILEVEMANSIKIRAGGEGFNYVV